MSETLFGKATGRVRNAHPAAQIGGAVALATALQQGIPVVLEYFEQKDNRIEAAHTSHAESLQAQLAEARDRNDQDRQDLRECELKLRDVLAHAADVPISAPMLIRPPPVVPDGD